MRSGFYRETLLCRLARQALLFGFLLLSATGLPAADKPHAPESMPGAVTVTAEVVVELILAQKDLLIVDSRKKSEYSKGHIEGAVNMLNTSMQREALEALCPNKATPIVFYCNGIHCLRSSDAIHKAVEWGYTNIFWFRGGWKEWTDKRLPLIAE